MIRRKDYPREFHIGDEIYRLKFVRKLPKDTVGECDPSSKEIRILVGQGKNETFKTVIHEIMHALFEFENDIEIKHMFIYKAEEVIFQFLRDNVFTRSHGKL